MAEKKKLKLKLWARQTQSPPAFEKLHDDVLDLILEQVYLKDRKDLRKTCRVSRRLYLHSVPWLYRHIKIGFARDSHIQLLQRLVRDDSKLLAKIRELEFT